MSSISKQSRAWLRGTGILTLLCLGSRMAQADPAWWSAGTPPVINGNAANNKGPATIGQAKWMAYCALQTLDTVDPTLATQIRGDLTGPGKVVPSWTLSTPPTADELEKQKAPLLLGQLKALAAPFYRELDLVAPTWLEAERSANLTERGGIFPWTDDTADDNNLGIATLGQLKAVFALHFETMLAFDGDGDGLPDMWEVAHGISPRDNGSVDPRNGASGDADGDGISNLAEMNGGTDPQDRSDVPVHVVTHYNGGDGDASIVGSNWSRSYRINGSDWITEAGQLNRDILRASFPPMPSAPDDDDPRADWAYSVDLNSYGIDHQNSGSSYEVYTEARIWMVTDADLTEPKIFRFLKVYEDVVDVGDPDETRTLYSSEYVEAKIDAGSNISGYIDLADTRPASFGLTRVDTTVHLIPIKFYRDRDGDINHLQEVNDWPADGSAKPRSPRQSFAKEDNLYIKIDKIVDFDTLKVKVTSDSDTTGVDLNLTDDGLGSFQNLNTQRLRLAESTGAGAAAATIKIVDEEVLNFKFTVNGLEATGDKANVMVDRAEFASGGAVFYSGSTGDEGVVRPEALDHYKFWDDGNLPLLDHSPYSPSLAKSFIKNAGDNTAASGQADILYFCSHGLGDGSGILVDSPLQDANGNDIDGTYDTLFTPTTDLTAGSTWNSDVEWVILGACEALSPTGGGRDAWKVALQGNLHAAHGIMGAFGDFGPDLTGPLSYFWDMVDDEGKNPPYQTLVTAFETSMDSDSQPWAVLYHDVNVDDTLRTYTRDEKAGSGNVFAYEKGTHNSLIATRATAPQALGDGHGSVTADFDAVDKAAPPIRGAIRVQPYDCAGAFAGLQETKFKSKDGLRLATDEHVVPRKGKLTQQEAEAEADAFIAKKVLPKGFTLVRQPTGVRTKEKFDSQGRQLSNEVTGYLVSYSEFYEGVKLGENLVNISFSDQGMKFVSVRLSDLIEPVSEKKATLKSKAALSGRLADIKGRLGIGESDKYEVSTADLCYVPDNENGFATGPVQSWVPSWHYVVNVHPGTPGSSKKHVWVNAENGQLIRALKP